MYDTFCNRTQLRTGTTAKRSRWWMDLLAIIADNNRILNLKQVDLLLGMAMDLKLQTIIWMASLITLLRIVIARSNRNKLTVSTRVTNRNVVTVRMLQVTVLMSFKKAMTTPNREWVEDRNKETLVRIVIATIVWTKSLALKYRVLKDPNLT